MKALLLLLILPALAFGEAGRTAAPFLNRPVSARASGMGQAFTAVAGGTDSLYYKPAGLGGASRPELSATVATGLADDSLGSLVYVHPTSLGAFSAGVLYLDGGNISLDLTSGLQESRKAEQDTAFVGAYSLQPVPGLWVGAAGKYIQSRLVERYTAKTEAFDAGVLWKTPLEGVDLGASAQNIGPDLKFEQKGDPLPRTTRFGAAYRRNFEGEEGAGYSLLLAADSFQQLYQDQEARLGLELTRHPGTDIPATATFRIGYLFARDVDSLTLGLGFGWERFGFDYAYALAKDLNGSHRLSLRWLF